MDIDLHTHTTASDGKLAPAELLQRAVSKGLRMLSITDHDTLAAYEEKHRAALTLIPGVEFSTAWHHVSVHIVGLNVALASSALREGVLRQQQARRQRAAFIDARLQRLGIAGALEGARSIAGSDDNIGRPHFAEYLVRAGAARSIQHAFSRFLKTRDCDSLRFWAPLAEVVGWIRAAGGIAVLAHPLKYRLSRGQLAALVEEFMEAGGRGLEVISGRQPPGTTRELARLCNARRLYASCGSDFHLPDQP